MNACTVVVPLYNARATVERALRSILAQTRDDYEVVVVDDGSDDGGGEAAAAAGGPRARVVRRENSGDCDARNRGVAEARTPYVAFLDADDEWRPAFLERALGFAEAHPEAAAVFTNVLSVRDGRPWLAPGFEGPRLLPDYLAFAVSNGGRGMTCSSTVTRRDALLAAGGFPEGGRRSGDVETWLRLALTGPVGFVPEALAAYHNEGRGRPAAPPYPQGVRTARRLRAEGRIPPRRVKHVRRLEALYLLTHARDLADAGETARAREVLLGDCPWRHCPPVPLAKALLRCCGI